MAKAKRIRGIKCDKPAVGGIELVLVTRFKEMHEWREAALDWSDPEGVHSMRVASRRLRSALRDFMPYLRKRSLMPVVKKLRRIADALGEVRDQDVAIVALEEIEKQVPAELSDALKQSIETRKQRREMAREDLTATLGTDGLEGLQSKFMSAVTEATGLSSARNGKRNSDRPGLTFREMSRAVILERLKEFEKLSDGLFQPLDVDGLHDMRIAVKRLRYALELFRQCWPRSFSAYAKRAARIQTALGDLHDCDMWTRSLGKQIVQARKKKDTDQVNALLWLLTHFIKLRTKYLRRALARWREWETHGTRDRLRKALAPEQDQPERVGEPLTVDGVQIAAGEQV
jgi:CHAD domain-containing protein